jgi:hypothetical protein
MEMADGNEWGKRASGDGGMGDRGDGGEGRIVA